MDKPIFMVTAAVILQKRVSNIAIQDKKKPCYIWEAGRDVMSIMNKASYYSDWQKVSQLSPRSMR
ncbi:hypothetical protein SM909_10990 [Klebsiella aerogenes]|uniref:hypothetical protein n=1 Tax=Klebsiella aerogenes TaxID=548 RepID=UPI002A80DB39|nr:hypothetical protein [Klebsiella aerogenes]WPR95848.1 hypothetical protein SM909_10990 [Klebsiella aerogenes]HBT3148789.1 hypothetical protein [Klebsiella aerogenes]